ncbi:aminodeoxychorismate synthase component I [Actinocrinis puniceicyclus]|uniref:aminodeoxychorismate synthase n=1 Tax=Actinocrinis puniceicyclus TaxID=977794 RepID=A0A8J7WJC0_9ACTN|nr:aminodeoxychorismate synthase component I [Actinocrinis puniceicyclus]MBS2962373.1 aminodeoxychorismate synthase component I [Actinocrinis puniceicyclus]
MIRCLLVDNYDSYTYNLFNLLAQVNGADPIVLRNDDPRVPQAAADADCVVVSPGPGDPRLAADFGACARLVSSGRVPLLGVCLGHQGIGSEHGAQVGPAPRARHGYVSRIKHDGSALFRGIPQGFAAVRYHSLCIAEPLPDHLEPLARSEDGVLMALRHRELPLWGVQFHPESVLTQYGAKLLANFRDQVERREARERRVVGTGFDAADAGAKDGVQYTAHVQTLRTIVAGDLAFEKLFGGSARAAWLDSSAPGPGSGRFSYLVQASDLLGEALTYRMSEGGVRVEAAGGECFLSGSIFDVLDTELARRSVAAPEVPFDFTGGYVGYFGYELKAELGAGGKYRSDAPDAVWLFADRVVVIDHDDRVVHLLALSTDDPDTQRAALDWIQHAGETLLESDLGHATEDGRPRRAERPAPATLRPTAEAALGRDRRVYLDDIAYAKAKLLAGESYEVCLTNVLRLPGPRDAFAFYRDLRACNPAPYSAFLSFGSVEVACSSPERFLKITRDRVVEAKPIKGTAPRGATPEDDARLREELRDSVKTLAENLMIVDLLRNDLSQVCVPGSVHTPALMRIESYATVHQMVSTIRGRLRDEISAIGAVRACFPGGSMTGAPKLRTMEIIDELEDEARGVYSGTIGFLACNGTADLNIVIRTAVLAGDELRIGAGGAIVLDSDPADEYDEMLLKAMAPLAAYREEAASEHAPARAEEERV